MRLTIVFPLNWLYRIHKLPFDFEILCFFIIGTKTKPKSEIKMLISCAVIFLENYHYLNILWSVPAVGSAEIHIPGKSLMKRVSNG